MLASYNSEKGNIEWLSGFKKELPEISKEVNDFFDLLGTDPKISFVNADEFVNFANGCNVADSTFKDFLSTTQKSGTVYKTSEDALAGYESYLRTTGKAANIANLKTKALSVSMKVLSSIGWMLAISAVVKGVELIGKGIDSLIVTTKEANEAMSEAVSEYESTKSSLENINTELDEQNKKIDELQAKEKLTYAEKGQLEELQEITKELLIQQDIEERRAERASKDVADKTVDAYEKQYGRYDISKEDLNEKFDHVKWSSIFPASEGENDITGNIAALTRAKELLSEEQQKYADAVKSGENTEWIESEIQRYTDMVDGYSSFLDDGISDLEEKRVSLSEEYAKSINQQDKGTEPLTSSQKETIETYEEIGNAIRLIYEYTNPNKWNTMQFTDIFNADSIEKTKENLVEMAESGELSPETISSCKNLNSVIEESDLILKDGQTAAEAFCEEIYALAAAEKEVKNSSQDLSPTLSISDTITQLNTQLKPAFESLKSAYQDIFTHEDGKEVFTLDNVDLSMLDSIKSAMDELGKIEGINVDFSSFENLTNILTNSSSTADDVQNSFNSLANSILDSSDVTEGLNSKTAQLVISMLDQLGVANAEEVVLDSLNTKTEALALQKQFAAQTGYELAAASSDTVMAFLDEAGASEVTRAALFKLIADQQIFNDQPLDTSGKVLKLQELATAYGQTAVAAKIAYMQEQAAKSHTQFNPTETDLANLQKGITDSINNVKINFDGVGKAGAKSAGKAGKETADKYLEGYKKELEQLDHIHEMGIISDREYYKQLNALNEKYFNNSTEHHEKYLSEYETNQEKVYKGLQGLLKDLLNQEKDGYDSALSAIDKLFDGEIGKLNDLKDASKDSYESQIDDIDKKIDRLEKERDARKKSIQDQIDSIKEENEELDRQKALEDAIYDQKRAQNQKELTYQTVDENGGQAIYKTNSKAESDTADAVDKAKDDIKLAELEKELDSLDDYYDNLISNLESQQDALKEKMDAVTASYEAQIKQLETNQQKYADIATAQEDSENKMMATALLGSNWQQLILSGRLDVLDAFKGSYLGICDEISNADATFRLDASTAAEGYAQSITDMLTRTTSLETLLQSWKDLNTGLSGVIGVGGSLGEETKSGNGQTTSGQDKATSSGASSADTITGAVTSGGIQIADTLTNQWVPAWQDVGNNMNTICGDIVTCVNEMASATVMACQQAITAINMANAAKNSGSTFNPTPGSFSGTSYQGKAYGNGTENAKRGINLIGEDGYELYADNNGNVSLATEPTLVKMQGGEKVIANDKTEKLLKPRNTFANGLTALKPLNNEFLEKMQNFNFEQFNHLTNMMFNIPDYSNIATARSQDIKIEIGDIKLEGVQDADALAKGIISKLPNNIMQEMYKK